MKNNFQSGFTLIEIMTAISIFIVVMTISMGSIIGVFDANRRSKSVTAVMSNLNLAIESMSREMRFGRNYHCGDVGNIATPRNCASGDDFVSFLSSDGVQIAYRLEDGVIEKSVDGGARFTAVTSPEIVIEDLTFYVLGAGSIPDNTLQPRALIRIGGYAGNQVGDRSYFTLQTLSSQRVLDN